MCTAVTYKTKDFYFGRTLDCEFSYDCEITITPRNYKFNFRQNNTLYNHYAIVGMAYVVNEYPLYYDAINEYGLGIAGLNFVGNAVYSKPKDNTNNIAQFELIPWVLSQCKSVDEAKQLLSKTTITDTSFSDDLPCAQLHWLISDKFKSIVVESMKDGIHIYDDTLGVLTNNPPFEFQVFALNNYINLSPKDPINKFSNSLKLETYSKGMGAIGLPGDLSSTSRFVRVVFNKFNSYSGDSENESVSQFFHILCSVEKAKGCCEVSDGRYEYTIYTSCCNALKGIYYYTTYENNQINAVDMNKCCLDGSSLIRYEVLKSQNINFQN